MTSEEIFIVSKLISAHPPVIIVTLCFFMYIRGRLLEDQKNSAESSLYKNI